MTRRLSPADLDRAAGCLLGQAAGDALGAGYEFRAPVPAGDARMIGGGIGDWAPGEWTDDTQQAVLVAEVAALGMDLSTSEGQEAVGERLLAWYQLSPPDVGNQTAAVLSRAASPSDLHRVAAEFVKSNPRSAGNGSLMRTGPVALNFLHLPDTQAKDDLLELAARGVSALTHAGSLSEDACVIWSFAIDHALRYGDFSGIRRGLLRLPAERLAFWEGVMDEAQGADPRKFCPNGYVVTALQAALAAVTSTPVPEEFPSLHLVDALQGAVSAGDDADTVAAIAGTLLGARWGATALPFSYRRLLHGWPDRTGNELVALAALAARRGGDDDLGWPTSPDLSEHYHRTYRQAPFVVSLPSDPLVLLGNVDQLASVKTDAVVSLCRIGSGQVRPEHVQVWLIDKAREEMNLNLEFLVLDAARAIQALRSEGKSVFVHCVAGASRTPTVAAAYLVLERGLSGREALEEVLGVLPVDGVNHLFRKMVTSWPAGGPSLPDTPAL